MCCDSTTLKRSWPEPVTYGCLPETPWLLFYSATKNIKTFATDTANIPLVQLKVPNPVSLQEKAALEYKLTQIYYGSKQELPSQPLALHQPQKDVGIFTEMDLYL